jgi:hypothetical protein
VLLAGGQAGQDEDDGIVHVITCCVVSYYVIAEMSSVARESHVWSYVR